MIINKLNFSREIYLRSKLICEELDQSKETKTTEHQAVALNLEESHLTAKCRTGKHSYNSVILYETLLGILDLGVQFLAKLFNLKEGGDKISNILAHQQDYLSVGFLFP